MKSDEPTNYMIAADWSRPFAERVRNAPSNNTRWDEAQLATIEAVVRRLVRNGWVRRRTSLHKSRASSRYLRRKEDQAYEIRISNHSHPHRKPLHDYRITDEIIQTYNVIGIIEWIERDYLKSQHVGERPD